MWSDDSTDSVITVNQAGTYWVKVSDSCGTVSDTINIYFAPYPVVDLGNDTTLCQGQSTILDAENMGSTYFWNDSSTNQTLTVTTEGTYIVSVTNLPGACLSIDSINVDFYPFSSSSIVADASCKGDTNGSIDFIVISGLPPFHFLWSNSKTTEDINNLSSGRYTLTVTDSVGCEIIDEFIVNEPDTISVFPIVTNLNCYQDSSGKINITASGGNGGYSYIWSTGASLSNITGLSAGTYYVTVKDSNNCQTIKSVDIQQPTQIILALSNDFSICSKTQNIFTSGGTPPYSYQWDNENTVETSCLKDGKHILTVTDANHCTNTLLYEVFKLKIPTIFTPNGDAYNNTWKIENIELYGNTILDIEIYNRWGTLVFTYHGTCSSYGNPINQWNGTFKEKPIEISSFVYIVSLDNKTYEQGIVSIIK